MLASTERLVDGRVRRVYVIIEAGHEALRLLRALVAGMAGEVLHPGQGKLAE